MKKLGLLTLLSLVFLFACNTAPPVDKEAGEAAALDVLKAYYNSFGSLDFETMKSYVADGYETYDQGHVMDFDGLVDMINGSIETMQLTDLNFSIELSGSEVFAGNVFLKYKLTGKANMAGNPIAMEFLETGLFVKVEDAWKIKFIHSTLIPPPEPEAEEGVE